MKRRTFSTIFAMLLTQSLPELDFGLGIQLKTKAYSVLMPA
jgi:hypothetical protein